MNLKLFYAAIVTLSITTPITQGLSESPKAPDLYFGEWEVCSPPSIWEEEDLFFHLSTEQRGLYTSLDCQGKRRAIALSKKTPNKSAAVEQAAKEMAERQRRKPIHPTDRIEEYGGQDKYNKYGY